MAPWTRTGERETAMVIGPVLLGIGLGLLAGELLAGVLIGLGAGITLSSVLSAVRSKELHRRSVD